MRIQHNISSMNTFRNLSANNFQLSKSLEKLSSGYKINRAGDDAAGLAISEKMRGQIRGLNMASKNAQDGISLIQTAEGAMNEVHSLLQRGRELVVQAANDTNVQSDREALQLEINAINEEIDRIGSDTEFNTQKILNGVGFTGGGTFDRDAFVEKLKSGWLEAAEKVINSALGTSVGDWVTQDVDVVFQGDGPGGAMASVRRATPPNALTLSIDASDFATSSEAYQKHTMVHELVHAAMNNNGTIGKSPGWFNEGIAEFIPGGEAYNRIQYLTIDMDTLANTDIQSGNNLSQEYYAASYGAVMYLNNTLVDNGHTMSRFISDLKSNSFNDVLNNLTGFATAGDFINDYKTNGGAYLDAVKNGGAGYASLAKGLFTGNIDAYFNAKEDISDSSNIKFNYIIDNSSSGTLSLHIGANEEQSMEIDLPYISAAGLGTNNVDITNGGDAAISIYDSAINNVSLQRAQLGAYQNRLEHAINNLGTTAENLTSAESRVRDSDMASEMMNYTKQNILIQAAQSMLAQANQQPQGILQLLG